MITYKQLTLAEIFEDCQNKFDNDKYQFLSLLDEAINLDEIVSVFLFLTFTPALEDLENISFIQCLEMMLATYKNDKEKFVKVVKTLVDNQNSNAQVTSVLHVLNDCDAVGDMHFIEDRDYFMKIAKRMEQELEV